MMFTRQNPRLGEEDFVFTQLFTISNGGKTNVNNNFVFTTALRHRNPILDCDFARALLLTYRWRCMGEQFPSLLEYSDYMERFVLRLKGDAKTQTTYSNSYDIHKALHGKFGVCVRKVLHQGRAEGQSNANEDGVDLKDTGRMAHNLHTEQVLQPAAPPLPPSTACPRARHLRAPEMTRGPANPMTS